MPYIPNAERLVLDHQINPLTEVISSPGQLNYAISRLVLGYLSGSLSYSNIASVTGVLENVKQELHRRLFAPYEDGKKDANGDIF